VQQYLGAIIDTTKGVATPSPQRIQNFNTIIQRMYPTQKIQAKMILQLLGMMSSCIAIVPNARLHMRPLQQCLASQWSQAQGHLLDLVLIDRQTYLSLLWWNNINLNKGRPFQDPVPQYVITTDASMTGWGAHLDQHSIQGQWNVHQTKLHINHLELLAVFQALKAFQPIIVHKYILVKTDNMTTMYYLNKQGGTHSTQLSLLAQKNWRWAIHNQIRLIAQFIPGIQNQLADNLSRDHQQVHEWEIHPQILNTYFKLWGTPQIDLFATKENAKCQNFASRYPHKQSQGNALWINWSGIFA
ncbi:hypothetical protein NDU88_000954, partial [Pleurodeles waltl]